MLDVDSGEQIDALYRMVQIKGGNRIEKFKTTELPRALRFHRWYINRYKAISSSPLSLPALPSSESSLCSEKSVLSTANRKNAKNE